MTLTRDAILAALRNVKYPGYSRDIVSFGLVKDVQIDGAAVGVQIELTSPNQDVGNQIANEARDAIRNHIPGITDAHVQIRLPAQGSAPVQGGQVQKNKVEGIRRIIAVASGKGGVGKSTCAVNLACALTRLGAAVGLLDCDIYGPSVPLMMGVSGKPQINEKEQLVPVRAHGVGIMSMGLLLQDDQPVIWRGPMIQRTIQQFISQVDWGTLDYLVVDLPPGTGDAQLSLCQTVPLDGGVVVTTPQEASLGVVRKGIGMFEKVQVPILGIIENMSYFTAPDGTRCEIFGHGGGRLEAQRKGVPFLGEIPIFTAIREGGDQGMPITISAPESQAAEAFLTIGRRLRETLG